MFYEQLRIACAKRGTSPTTLLKNLGMSTSSVTSWKNGVLPHMSTIYKLASALDVDPKTLLDGEDPAAGLEEGQGVQTKKAPPLSEKEQRDIARDLERIMDQLEDSGDLMFDGDPMSDEARESIRAAMKLGLEAARLKNKERFGPKKGRKE